MKKNLLALSLSLGGVLLCAGGAHAQSSVEVSGLVDVFAGSIKNSGDAGRKSVVDSGGLTTSWFGFKGSEDLGGGAKALFNLESGLNADTGAPANATKYFDRASWVGLQGGWGTLALGRQTTTLADAISPVDPLAMRFASFNPNIGVTALSQHGLGIEYGSAGANSGS